MITTNSLRTGHGAAAPREKAERKRVRAREVETVRERQPRVKNPEDNTPPPPVERRSAQDIYFYREREAFFFMLSIQRVEDIIA